MALVAFSWNPLDWAKGALSWFGEQVSEAASGLLGDIFEWIAGLLIRGIVWLFDVLLQFVSEATSPDLEAGWFQDGPMSIAKNIAAYLLFLFVILAIAEAVWNRDGGQLLRSTAQDLPRVMFLELMLITGTMGALAAGDFFSIRSLDLFGENIKALPEALNEATDGLVFGVGVLVICLVGLFLLLAAVFVTFELVLREGLILVLVPLVGVLLATEVYRPTKGMGSRAMRLLGVTIAMKPAVALCLAIGAAALGQEAVTANEAAPYVATPEPTPVPHNPNSFGPTGITISVWVEAMKDAGIPERYLTRDNCIPEYPAGCSPLTLAEDGRVLRADGAEAYVAPGDEDPKAIENADTSAVAPTFGLMLAGLAVMVLAAMSPFLLMRLISIEAASESQAWRQGVGGAARSGASKASNFATGGAGVAGGAAGAMGRAAGRGAGGQGSGGAAANKAAR